LPGDRVLAAERVDLLEQGGLAIAAQEGPRPAVRRDLSELLLRRGEAGAPERPDRTDLGRGAQPALLLERRAAPGERVPHLAIDLLRRVVQEQGVVGSA